MSMRVDETGAAVRELEGGAEIRSVPVDYETNEDPGWTLDDFIKEQRKKNKDCRIVVSGRNSGVGLGKSTCAVGICKKYGEADWNAEEKAALEANEAINMLQTVEPESAVLLDEIGVAADNRRSSSKTNVDLTQLYRQARYKNLIIVATVPSIRMVDKRLVELSDLRLHIVRQGLGKVYQYQIRDSDPRGDLQPDLKTFFEFPPLDGDPDYEKISRWKAERFEGKRDNEGYVPESEVQERLKEEKEELEKEMRQKRVRSVYDNTELSQSDVGELHGEVYGDEISQQAVSNLL